MDLRGRIVYSVYLGVPWEHMMAFWVRASI